MKKIKSIKQTVISSSCQRRHGIDTARPKHDALWLMARRHGSYCHVEVNPNRSLHDRS